MAIESFSYPRTLSFYNSERREQKGTLYYTGDYKNGLADYYKMGNVQQFSINADDPSDVILFTYANGVKVKLTNQSAQWSTTAGGVPCIDLHFTVQHVDIYDNVIHETTTTIYDIDATSSSMNSIKLYYCPTFTSYWQSPNHRTEVGDSATTIAFDKFFAHRAGKEPEGAPNLFALDKRYLADNHNFDHGINDYYYTDNAFSLHDQEDYDDFIADIVDGGDDTPISPQLPSDDTSDPGGGDDDNPDYNPFSDTIGFPDMPIGGDALSSGFIRAYTPTTSQLQAIARKLWSNDFYETILKINNDPMEAIISLHSIPFTMTAGQGNCVIGNYDTGISVGTLAGQFYRRHLGSIYIPEHWASALDYSPYNTIDIFLPYIGVRSLQVDDIIGKTIDVEYMVDVITGAAVCHIKCGDSVLYTYNANLMMKIPVTMSSMEPLLNSLKGATGNVISGASGGAGGALGAAVGSAINVATSKHSMISRGSSLTGSFGCLSIFTPYLIIHRPIQSLASGFGHFKGYPSNITATIGSVSGYSEVESVHLTGIPCTDIERDEITALLYNGVIV